MEALTIETYKYFTLRLNEAEVRKLIKIIPMNEEDGTLMGIRATLRLALLCAYSEGEDSRENELLENE